jgi:hypothetical protein
MEKLILAHDAGGAEVLSSYVSRNPGNYIFCLKGPSEKIFRKKLGNIKNTILNSALEKCNELLCGTGWQTNFEYDAICKAKEIGVKSIAFLDHWVNYEERFVRNGVKVLPDELWVGDHYALEIANKTFGTSVVIKYVESPYFLDIKAELDAIQQPDNSDSILYVCEPIAAHALKRYGKEDYWGYTEFDALRFFLDNIKSIDEDVKKVIVRPHPSEDVHKYDKLLTGYKLNIVVSRENSLLTQVVNSKVIVGCQSMAMVVGVLAGKKVVSSIPVETVNYLLPYQEIESMVELIRSSKNS